jgi:hypothetical protein
MSAAACFDDFLHSLRLRCSLQLIPLISLIVQCVDLSLDFLRALTLVACPVEAFVMVTSIDLGNFGIQRRGSLVIRKPLGKRRLPTWPNPGQCLMGLS